MKRPGALPTGWPKTGIRASPIRLRALGAAISIVTLGVVLQISVGPAAAARNVTPSTAATVATTASANTDTNTFDVTCVNNPVTDTGALANAISSAEASGGTVQISAGTCAVDKAFPVTAQVTIEGAGATATSLVQHNDAAIFNVKAQHVTVQDLNLDTATYNTTIPPSVHDDTDPLAMVSDASYTTVSNVDAETGGGFGIRLVGPNPCYTDLNTGDVIRDVNVTTIGIGGYAGVDVDCQNGATLDDIVISGGYLALYQDQNVTVTNESFTPGPYSETCQAPWFITGPTQNMSLDSVTSSGGDGKISETPGSDAMRANSPVAQPYQTAQNIVADNQQLTNSACEGIMVEVSGTDVYGSAPSFTETNDAPAPVTLSGTLACTYDSGGTKAVGSTYTVNASTCSGLTPSDADYTITYAGLSGGFVVSPATITVEVSGTDVYGSAPSFTETNDAPAAVTLSGTLACTDDSGGTQAVGTYTVDAGTCAGLTPSDATDYTITYAGSSGGFVVNRTGNFGGSNPRREDGADANPQEVPT